MFQFAHAVRKGPEDDIVNQTDHARIEQQLSMISDGREERIIQELENKMHAKMEHKHTIGSQLSTMGGMSEYVYLTTRKHSNSLVKTEIALKASDTVQKQICCSDHRVVTVVAVKLWL